TFMRLKTRTWALISVVCFVAAFVFWKLGEKEMDRKRSAREPGVEVTEPKGEPSKPLSDANRVVSPANLVTTADEFPISESKTNLAEVYRLRNTTQTAGQLARDNNAV